MKGDIQMKTYTDAPLAPPPYPGLPAETSYPGNSPGQSNPNYYPPPPAGRQNVTIVYPNNPAGVQTNATVVVANNMGPIPTVFACPSCKEQILTRIKRAPSIRTHVLAVMLCIFGCWPCVVLPYCLDSCNNAEHYCPNCSAYIGTYRV